MSATRQEAVVISGRKLARQIREEARVDVENWVSSGHRRPHLSVVLVGDDPASHSYVLNKARSAAEVGISSETILKTSNTSEEELLDLIDKLNNDHLVDGLLVQLPLPDHIDERRICNAVSPCKDVDGFHVVNVGRLCLDQSTMLPATPWGIMEIIKRTGDATVTISHRYTPKDKLRQHTQMADIIIAAAGIPNLITADMIKEGAAVIDVGINRVLDPLTGKSRLVGDVDFEGVRQKAGFITPVPGGIPNLITADMIKEGAAVIDVGINRVLDPLTGKSRLVGDVDFEGVRQKAGFITPVPGGVGPMTVAMLMKNTIKAAKNILLYPPERIRLAAASSSSSSSTSSDEKAKRKKKKAKKRKLKKEKAKLKKLKKQQKRKEKKLAKKLAKKTEAPVVPPPPVETIPSFLETWQSDEAAAELGPVMTDEQKARLSTKRPLTKEEYEARQSIIRRVVDPESGRTRLVRGEGEIIEEMVTKEKHKDINKQSTKGDGNAFQKKMGLNRKREVK
ncbi:hypothetical protein CRUP_037336 [Coryphaenoides rupestris]|nr:hypothetical protein CRUP_037336 [Coryphaenoides rupestris]